MNSAFPLENLSWAYFTIDVTSVVALQGPLVLSMAASWHQSFIKYYQRRELTSVFG